MAVGDLTVKFLIQSEQITCRVGVFLKAQGNFHNNTKLLSQLQIVIVPRAVPSRSAGPPDRRPEPARAGPPVRRPEPARRTEEFQAKTSHVS